MITIDKKELYNYTNGDYNISIYEDGSKVREWDDNTVDPISIYPESIDFKITNYCDLHNYCKWCHEASDKNGKHADLTKYTWLLEQLPNGAELAIGGGDPLSHPNLIDFLKECKKNHIIPNLTVNELHLKKNKELLNQLIDEKLIYGLGISYSGKQKELIKYFNNKTNNLVLHVITGINAVRELDDIINLGVKKVLVLGYKDYRKGETYHDEAVDKKIYHWYIWLHEYFKKIGLSFDNLALDQLNVKRFFTDDYWNTHYMGDDGTHTMYIDASENAFSKSSTCATKASVFPDIKEVFKMIKTF